MGLIAWAERCTKKLHWYDVGWLKLGVLAFALWVAKLWPVVLGLNAWVYAVVWVGCTVYLSPLLF